MVFEYVTVDNWSTMF